MVGDLVMTQKDVQTELTKPDAIGMGSYNSDSHNVQRFVECGQGGAENEGDVEVAVESVSDPLPVHGAEARQATNLLVPVCMSASHVAYSSLRMEPQYMEIGQAAGVAAAMAIAAGSPVQDIDTPALTAKLRQDGVVMEYHPPVPAPVFLLNRRL